MIFLVLILGMIILTPIVLLGCVFYDYHTYHTKPKISLFGGDNYKSGHSDKLWREKKDTDLLDTSQEKVKKRKRPMRSVYYTLERLNGKNVSKKYYEKEEQAIRDSERCRRSMVVPKKEPLNIVRRTEEIVKVVTE